MFLMFKKKFLKFLCEKNIIKYEGNVCYAEKAFRLNSVLNWCLEKKDAGVLKKCMHVFKKFIDEDAEIILKDDKILIKKNKKG